VNEQLFDDHPIALAAALMTMMMMMWTQENSGDINVPWRRGVRNELLLTTGIGTTDSNTLPTYNDILNSK